MERSELSGLSAEEFFRRGEGYGYDNFTTLDTFKTEINNEDIFLKTDLGKGVILYLPIIGSPMDSVVNARVAIVLALHGGIAVIHYNHKKSNNEQDIDAQIAEIDRVKRYQSGFIEKPITVSPEMNIAQVLALAEGYLEQGMSITNFPVTENGKSNGKLLGLLRRQDYFRGSRVESKVSERMLPLRELKVATEPVNLEQAVDIIWNQRLNALPIVNNSGNLVYLVTRSDIEKRERYPLATLDSNNRLRVLFAVNTRPNESYERLERGFAAGADGVVVDVSQGYDKHEEAMLKYIVKKYPEKLLIGGNISTKEAAAFLAGLGGVDAYRNGQGPGSSCLTEKVIGASRAAATGVYDCAKALRGSSLKTIADGSLAWTGSIFKALSLGAHACMLGNMLAATEEGPGEIKFNKYGDPVKDYWGMGSERAGVGARRNYSRMPEGGEKQVPFKGSLHTYLPKIKSALIHAFEVKNMRSIEELHEATYSNKLRFERFMGTPNGSLAEL